MGTRKNVLFSFIVLVIFMIVVEIFAQVLFRFFLHRDFDERRKYLERYQKTYSDGKKGYRLNESIIASAKRKSEKITLKKANGNLCRIFIVGDSMIHQSALKPEERTSYLLHNRLNTSPDNTHKYEVIDLACSGYNLIQEATVISDIVFSHQPDYIVWFIFIHNDFENLIPNDVRGLEAQIDIKYIGNNSFALKIARESFWVGYVYNRVTILFLGLPFELPSKIFPNIFYPSKAKSYVARQKETFTRNYKQYCNIIYNIAQECSIRDIKLKLLLLPRLRDISNNLSYFWKEESKIVMSELQDNHGLKLIDLKPLMSNWKVREITDNTEHLSKKGALQLSEILNDILIDDNRYQTSTLISHRP